MRALVVEDEPLLRESLDDHLFQQGFTTDLAIDKREAEELLISQEYDLLLLDLSLPDGDGLDLLNTLKATDANTATIILSARGELEDRILGLERGSDDYLPKPFSMLELTARIHAVLRRRFKIQDNYVKIGELTIYLDTNTILYKDNNLEFTDTEYRILRYLALNKNKTVTRITLSEHIWGDKVDDRFSLDFVNSHIKNIRRKFSSRNFTDPIKTVYGIGYRMEDV
ncbi:MAG TPA: DNA-binding response regulator [Balneolaceae bacterium]|nr:DNA-binding response regulator [Balneolaceae bacterium]|tara:strand:+ start:118202 stop:118879 length:678 start_codon:yes stop_codon:yes gene_type:complete